MVTPPNPLPHTNNFCLYPPSVFRCFWKDLLMINNPPPTTPLKASFTAIPSPSTTLSLPKNFDHTLSTGLFGWCSAGGRVFSTPSQTTLSLKLDYSNFVQNYFGIMYQSILSLTTPRANPLEILLKGRIPHPWAQKVRNLNPWGR